MKKSALLGCLGLLIVFLLFTGLIGGCSYNGLVRKSQSVDAQWAQVQNVYQRRADLIPNLVQTVQGSADFEKSTLTQVTEARASVGRVTLDASKAPEDAKQLEEFQRAQGQLSTALSRLLVVSEQYPQLRATENFRNLMAQLEGSENRITVERQKFNDVARDYNVSVQSFPTVIFANIFGFRTKPYFTAITPGAETAPGVKFNFK